VTLTLVSSVFRCVAVILRGGDLRNLALDYASEIKIFFLYYFDTISKLTKLNVGVTLDLSRFCLKLSFFFVDKTALVYCGNYTIN